MDWMQYTVVCTVLYSGLEVIGREMMQGRENQDDKKWMAKLVAVPCFRYLDITLARRWVGAGSLLARSARTGTSKAIFASGGSLVLLVPAWPFVGRYPAIEVIRAGAKQQQ